MASKRPPAYVAALKVQVTILCLFGGVLAAYYFFYVTLHQTYLIERDFRLLATLGDEIVDTIQSQSTVIGNIVSAPKQRADGFDFLKRHATHFVPALRSAKFPETPKDPKTFIVHLAEPDSRLLWANREDSAGKDVGVVRLELRELLEPLLNEGRGAFDALLIATPDGRVVFQSGDVKLRMASLEPLIRRTDPKAPEITFRDLASAPALTDVVVSGAKYKLLTQPCCGRMIRVTDTNAPVAEVKSSAEGRPSAETKPTGETKSTGEARSTADGWVLCGLVATHALSSKSYAVSFSTLTLLCGLLLLGLLSWPFLKLTFLGEAQRVKAYNVVLVVLSTMVGLSLLTIAALDYIAYGRELQTELDRQLRALADEINQQAGDEIAQASRELQTLQNGVRRQRSEAALHGLRDQTDPVDLTHIGELFAGTNPLVEYPYFRVVRAHRRTGHATTEADARLDEHVVCVRGRPRVLHSLADRVDNTCRVRGIEAH